MRGFLVSERNPNLTIGQQPKWRGGVPIIYWVDDPYPSQKSTRAFPMPFTVVNMGYSPWIHNADDILA
ncbi:hypothetical protein PQD73_gp012 [Stenotrophomonas phage Salva]|uniref:Uncharacterized protein n=1 Tax=Stenotrophomonas phage Salva TaxID=2801524 RepID=A0A7U3WJU3_9CAUD|nr:hypothetical protein PQD73_gp012 [Stenotrophomonas phage Salva]QQM18176.1 hypothetical protein CPT_Salva_012 [Stenotrophomonas phage Salva]